MPGAFLISDLAAVFNEREFGEATVVIDGVIVPGAIFDNEDIEVQMGEGVGQIVHQPMITCPIGLLHPLASNQVVTVAGSAFRVKNWKDDGTGVVEIYLEGPL